MRRNVDSTHFLSKLLRAEVVCKACGQQYGKYSVGCSSTWEGTCDVCGEAKPVTEVRDWGYLSKGISKGIKEQHKNQNKTQSKAVTEPIMSDEELEETLAHTKLKKENVEHCLKTFNFERVHKAMEQAEWKWYTSDGYHVPTIVQLILAAQDRLNTAWDQKTTIESGGLRAKYVPGEIGPDGHYEKPGLELLFILTQTQSY